MTWTQTYDPLGQPWLSTLCAALPIVALLGSLAFLRLRAHTAALIGLGTSLLMATAVFGMPVAMALASAGYGAAFGLLPIGWIVLNVIFLYQLTAERGLFATLRQSITHVTTDARLQLLLVAFAFGAFFEGAAGFGTPVAVTGTPLIALSAVSGLDLHALSGMVGRQLPFFSVLVPFWLVAAFAGWRGMLGIWPAILMAGVPFAALQFLVSNLHGPWLVDVVASIASMAALVLFLRVWRPRDGWDPDGRIGTPLDKGAIMPHRSGRPCLGPV